MDENTKHIVASNLTEIYFNFVGEREKCYSPSNGSDVENLKARNLNIANILGVYKEFVKKLS